jgi:hypothetical protein
MTSLRVKLIAACTTIALFALPATEALAHTSWV